MVACTAPLLIQPNFYELPAYLAFAEAHALGFELIDFVIPDYYEDASLRQKVMRAYRGTPVYSLHAAYIDLNPASPDEALRTLSRRRIEQSVQTACEMDVVHVVVHATSFPAAPFGWYMEDWAAHCAEFYRSLADRYPVSLYLENVFDTSPVFLQRLLLQTAHPRIRACLDCGHAHISHMPLHIWETALGDQVAYYHLSDNHGRYDEHLPLGTGDAPLPARLNGPATLEVAGLDALRASLGYLSTHNPVVGGIQ